MEGLGVQANTVLFCCSDDTPECIALARDWVKDKQLTAEDVRLVKRDGVVCVLAKRECNVFGG
jgi:ribosomal protein L36